MREGREREPGPEEGGQIGKGGPTDRVELRQKTGKKHETSWERGVEKLIIQVYILVFIFVQDCFHEDAK